MAAVMAVGSAMAAGAMAGTLTVSTTDAEGNEVPFFSMKFLIMKYLKMSDADFELNEKYKLEEKVAAKSDEDGEEGDDEEMSDDGGGDEGGDDGSESDDGGGDDIDDEMLGDVMGKSPETSSL